MGNSKRERDRRAITLLVDAFDAEVLFDFNGKCPICKRRYTVWKEDGSGRCLDYHSAVVTKQDNPKKPEQGELL